MSILTEIELAPGLLDLFELLFGSYSGIDNLESELAGPTSEPAAVIMTEFLVSMGRCRP
jgi:hypothetical protein